MVTSRLLAPALFALQCWLVLPGVFLFDDHSLFVNPSVTSPGGLSQLLHWTQSRPLTYLTFRADYLLWGPSPAGFHFTNLLIHAAAACLLFLCLRRLAAPSLAGIAGLFFFLHPLTAEPVYYVFARSSSLAAALSLASLWLWLDGRRWLAVACFAAALAAKEEAAAFPLALALLEYGRNRLRPALPALAAMTALSLAAGLRVIVSTRVVAGAGSGFASPVTPWEYFLQQGQAIPGYLWRIALPIRMSIDPANPSSQIWIGLVGWAALLLASAWLGKRYGLAPDRPALWLFAGFLILLPSSSILPAADAVAWRRLYLPMAFWCVPLAMAARKLRWAALAVLFWLAVTNFNASLFSSEQSVWAEAARLAPGKVRPLLHLARLTPPGQAASYLETAAELEPNNPEPPSQLGRVFLLQGDNARALAQFGKALALDPSNPRHIQNRGVALLLLGQAEAARADFQRALALDPCLGPARLNLEKLGVPQGPFPPSCGSVPTADAYGAGS